MISLSIGILIETIFQQLSKQFFFPVHVTKVHFQQAFISVSLSVENNFYNIWLRILNTMTTPHALFWVKYLYKARTTRTPNASFIFCFLLSCIRTTVALGWYSISKYKIRNVCFDCMNRLIVHGVKSSCLHHSEIICLFTFRHQITIQRMTTFSMATKFVRMKQRYPIENANLSKTQFHW